MVPTRIGTDYPLVKPLVGAYGLAAILPLAYHQSEVPAMSTLLHTFSHREEGQGLAEYALILALIAIVAIIALLFLGTQISSILSTIGNAV
jgi:pilus assembly protein Flp/PilA